MAEKTILDEAKALIYGDRQKAYGSASEGFRSIAAGWTEIVGVQIDAEQAALMMMWLKMVRQNHKKNRDHLIDIAGYVGCIDKIQKGE